MNCVDVNNGHGGGVYSNGMVNVLMLFTITQCYGVFSSIMGSSLDFDCIYLDFAKAFDLV